MSQATQSTLSVREVKRQLAVDPPAMAQRRIGTWVDRLRARALGEGLMPCVVAGLPIDLLDGLRSQLLVRGALVLRQDAIADYVSSAYPGVVLVDDNEDIRVLDVARLRSSPVRWGSAALKESARRSAYRVRREVGQRLEGSRVRSGAFEHVDVLAFARHESHLRDLAPVLKQLELGGANSRVLCVEGATAEASRSQGFETSQLLSFAGPFSADADAVAARLRFLRVGALAASAVDEANEAPLLRFLLRDVANGMVLEACRIVRAARNAFVAYSPRAIFLANPYSFEGRLISLTARACSVPVVSIEHGSIFPDDPQWAAAPVDRICVWGEASAAALLSCGVSAEAIVVTGSPRLDQARSEASGGARARQCVLVATSGPGDLVALSDHLKFVAQLRETIAQLPGTEFVVRLHPKDRRAYYDEAGYGALQNARIDLPGRTNSIYQALETALALVTVSSTTAVDAMVCDVPVISFRPLGIDPYAHVDYLSPLRTFVVRSAGELTRQISTLVEGGADMQIRTAASAYALRHFAHQGSAAVRAADVLRASMKPDRR